MGIMKQHKLIRKKGKKNAIGADSNADNEFED